MYFTCIFHIYIYIFTYIYIYICKYIYIFQKNVNMYVTIYLFILVYCMYIMYSSLRVEITKKKMLVLYRLRIQVVFSIARFELQTPTNDGKNRGDFDSRADMSVRVWKGGFMVETFRHSIFGPNVVFEIWNYIYCPSRRQQETTGDHGTPQRPDPAHRIWPVSENSGPLKLRLFGKKKYYCIRILKQFFTRRRG